MTEKLTELRKKYAELTSEYGQLLLDIEQRQQRSLEIKREIGMVQIEFSQVQSALNAERSSSDE